MTPTGQPGGRGNLPPSQFVDVGGPLHYREWPGPESPTFVCLHGLGETHLTWMTVAPSLATTGRVLGLDLPGFGLSPRSGRSATLAACQTVVSGFLRARASGPVVLVGSSMGGGIAALEAAREPDSVAAVVLSSSYLPPDLKRWRAPAVAGSMLVNRVRSIVESLRVSRPWEGSTHWVTESSLRTALANPGSMSDDVVAAELDLHERRPDDRDDTRTAAEAIASLVQWSVTPISTRRLYESIKSPTLVVHGRDDSLVPISWAEVLVVDRPSWRLVALEGAGHPVHLAEPEAWIGAVGEWLTSRLDGLDRP